jgi:ATP-dependent Lhr-like helicase
MDTFPKAHHGMDSDDTLEAMVIARRALQEQLEPVQLPDKPYDVLTHQIAGLLMKNRRLNSKAY